MSRVVVDVTRAALLDGRRIEAGTQIEVEALDAAALVDSARAELHRQADAAVLDEARRAADVRALRLAGRQAPLPSPGPGWRAL